MVASRPDHDGCVGNGNFSTSRIDVERCHVFCRSQRWGSKCQTALRIRSIVNNNNLGARSQHQALGNPTSDGLILIQRDRQSRQNPNNGDHDRQFDQRKTPLQSARVCSCTMPLFHVNFPQVGLLWFDRGLRHGPCQATRGVFRRKPALLCRNLCANLTFFGGRSADIVTFHCSSAPSSLTSAAAPASSTIDPAPLRSARLKRRSPHPHTA